MKKLSSAIFILLLLYVKSDKIIRYNGYFDEVKRREILENALLAPFLLNSLVESRKTHFSDFDLVKDARLIILPHPLIRDIQLVNNSRRHLNFRSISRRRSGLDINVAEKLQADKLWAHGYTGKGIRIAIFDTGLTSKRANFHNVVVERDYTDEHSPNDSDGHGTFVAGVIAGSNRRCTGIAPEAELYIYKVFGKGQESRTSWFLDAFNDAIQHRVDIINLRLARY
jgi:subtilisin family serine protease